MTTKRRHDVLITDNCNVMALLVYTLRHTLYCWVIHIV